MLKLLELRNTTKIYRQRGASKNEIVALDRFNLTIAESPATITTIAGESGSGKTTLANAVLGFVKLTSGQIFYRDQDLTTASADQRRIYCREVQAVFQDPFGVYNPFYRIQHVFNLVIKNFKLCDPSKSARDLIEEALNVVGMEGEDVLRKYPHQLSGGQRQRIMLARAFLIKPKIIVADEPVSMVDASLRASILDLMLRLKSEHGISFLYITHDLSTAYQISDQIYILYQGAIAECGESVRVIDHPHHPYVQLLIDSVPVPDPEINWDGEISIPSDEEFRQSDVKGCRFYPRCPKRIDRCLSETPSLYSVDQKFHDAACFLFDDQFEKNQ